MPYKVTLKMVINKIKKEKTYNNKKNLKKGL